ncbi:hypothetical protein H4R99_006371 [Coemansia sp. RSA 1722]|nr:hypothetical protein LPJ57_001881 [Coemansia sp. RSA 486]KAJ2592549.1 hypothetical protein H4R99_006371 [Coemansia sp. RSA 1722]
MDPFVEETDDSASNSSFSGVKTPKNYSYSPFVAQKTLREKTTIYEISESDALISDVEDTGTEAKDNSPGTPIRGRKLYLALAGLDALLFIAALDLTIIATVYVEIANNFNALSRAEWTVTSYMLAATAIQPLYGKFSDILGRAEAIVVSVLLFLAGSVMCAMSKSMDMLIASRAVQGLGGGGIMSLIFVVIADVLSERERGKYIGIFTCTWGFASAVAPVLGGLIIEKSNWRLIFWANLPVCAIALALVLFFMRLPKPSGSIKEKAAKIDIIGSLVFLCGTLPLLMGLSWGGREHSWTSPLVLTCVIGGTFVLGIFVLIEMYIPKEPIIPSRLLAIRNVSVSAVSHFFYGAAAYGPIVFIPQWALLVRGASAISAGLHLLPFTIGTIVTSIAGGFVMSRTGRYRRIIVSGAVLLTIGNCLLVLFDQHIPMKIQAVVLVLCGLGAGACIQPVMMAAQAAVSGHDMAAVTTLCAFLRSLGGIICVAVLSSIMHSVIKTGLTRLAVKHPQAIFVIVQVAENQAAIYADSVPEELRATIISIFMYAMRLAFYALIPFSTLLLLVTLCFEHLELNKECKQTIE